MNRNLLTKVLPKFAEELKQLLLADGYFELANQIDHLEIYEKCSCGDLFCSSFYTAQKLDGPWGPLHQNI